MKGIFSIEWMAQSSQSTSTESVSGPQPTTEPSTCGTHSESLPGFYCRQKTEIEQQENRRSGLGAYSSHNLSQHTSHNPQETEADFSSGTEEETSGYESEEGNAHSPTAPANSASTIPPSPPSGRRPRTAFTAEQINSLEQAFKRNAYLGTQDKAELCKKLNLSDKQIRNWFQNRRMKLKRTVQDALAHACQANVASQFMHYPELQTYRASPYPRYHSASQESPVAATPYIHPHSLQYNSPLAAGMSTLPRDSMYQYSSLPSVMLPSAATPLMGSYAAYPQYY